MPKQVKLVDYLTEDELKQKYRYCRDRVESRRWHLLWKISQSWTIKDSAAAVGISYEYARKIVRKYNAQGIESVQNKRVKVGVKGRPALLDSEQLEKLAATLKQRPSDGGIWTGAKVAGWIEQEIGKSKVGNQRGWDYLKKCPCMICPKGLASRRTIDGRYQDQDSEKLTRSSNKNSSRNYHN